MQYLHYRYTSAGIKLLEFKQLKATKRVDMDNTALRANSLAIFKSNSKLSLWLTSSNGTVGFSSLPELTEFQDIVTQYSPFFV